MTRAKNRKNPHRSDIRPINKHVIAKPPIPPKKQHHHHQKQPRDEHRRDQRPSSFKPRQAKPRRPFDTFTRPYSPSVFIRRSLSPVCDSSGKALTSEEQRSYYRNKAEKLEFRFAKDDLMVSNALKTNNILAIAAGLVINDPEGCDKTPLSMAVPLPDACNNVQPKTSKRFKPVLPQIVENDVVAAQENDIIILDHQKKQPRRKCKRRRRKGATSVQPTTSQKMPIVVIDISDSDTDSDVIILDDIDDAKTTTTRRGSYRSNQNAQVVLSRKRNRN